jgi:acyl-CoA reductase-like NAD-dependent aldehyde dehydrogenase/nicotinamidase-related amidase
MNTALLLVDIQEDYLKSSHLQPVAESLIAQAKILLAGCRLRQIPGFHVWTTIHRENDQRLPHWKKSHLWQCVDGTDGHKTPESLQPLATETIIHKSGFNGFAGGKLETALKQIDCDTIVLAGIHLHTCVRTLAAEGLERGLKIFIAEDAVATNDPIYAAATRRWLAARGVEFISTAEILSRLDGKAPAKLIHRSPRETGQILFEIPIASADEIAAATQRAKSAGQRWRQTSLALRCDIFEKAVAQLEFAATDWARQMALEIGKPVSHGMEEVRRAAANVRDVIRRARAFEFETILPGGSVRHQPLGVVALISPWNNPVAIPVGKMAPALIYGNTVVWKPAPAAAKISEAILRLFRSAGVPAAALQILNGDHTTAQALAADKTVDAVTITSSAQAGFAIQEICARRFLPLQAELSGNNAAIVWDDADLPAAAAQIVGGAFGFAGQRCTANRRVIVSAGQFEIFWRELKIAGEKLHWGDPLETVTDIGPVIHAAKGAEQTALIRAAEISGAAQRVDFLFEKRVQESWMKNGAYAQPVMIYCDQPDHRLVQEETMSPLLIVQRATDFEQALELCNGVRHGLVAALFSDAPAFREKFLAEARAGMLKINSSTAGADVTLPFGGWKMSGLGPPEHGEADRLFYTQMQAVYGLKSSPL